jgi:hypothetical protein
MKNALVFAAIAALSLLGCKKKEQGAGGGSAEAVAAAPAAKASEPAAAPAGEKPKTCEELGGKMQGPSCAVKTAAPIDVAFTGRFDTDMMHPDPGAVFKVTNKLAVPVKINTAQLYAYDKSGKQLDIDINGTKNKYSQESQGGLVELDPKESKEFVHGIGKKNLPPEMDTVQVELISWSVDGKDFSRDIDNMDARPKDGWK